MGSVNLRICLHCEEISALIDWKKNSDKYFFCMKPPNTKEFCFEIAMFILQSAQSLQEFPGTYSEEIVFLD